MVLPGVELILTRREAKAVLAAIEHRLDALTDAGVRNTRRHEHGVDALRSAQSKLADELTPEQPRAAARGRHEEQ
jgi:hypothetical protein